MLINITEVAMKVILLQYFLAIPFTLNLTFLKGWDMKWSWRIQSNTVQMENPVAGCLNICY